jgi:hypothetical protein
MCNTQPVITGNEKLKKMIVMVQIILIINLVSSFLRLFLNPSDMIMDLFGVLFLYLAAQTLYFLYMAIYILLSLLNALLLFVNCGTLMQMVIQKTLGDLAPLIPRVLGISLYLLVFYVFAIIFTYPVYKEMKAQLMESFGGGSSIDSRNYSASQDQERPQSTDASQNSRATRFQAFAGRGVAVGGNN